MNDGMKDDYYDEETMLLRKGSQELFSCYHDEHNDEEVADAAIYHGYHMIVMAAVTKAPMMTKKMMVMWRCRMCYLQMLLSYLHTH